MYEIATRGRQAALAGHAPGSRQAERRCRCTRGDVAGEHSEREIVDSRPQSLFQANAWPPVEQVQCPRDHRLASLGIVLGQRTVLDFRAGPGLFDDHTGDLPDRGFAWIAEIARPRDVFGAFHQKLDTAEQIVDEAERSRLRTIAIECD